MRTTVPGAPYWTAGDAEAPSYLDVTGGEIVFVLIGVITLCAALLCVTSRNVVRAALWLVVALGGLAGLPGRGCRAGPRAGPAAG